MSSIIRNTTLVLAAVVSLGFAATSVPAQAGALSTALENDSSVVWTSFADKRTETYPSGPRGGR